MMNSKRIKGAITLMLACLIALAGFLAWNSSLFGKALPTQVEHPISTQIKPTIPTQVNPTISTPLINLTPATREAMPLNPLPPVQENTNSSDPAFFKTNEGTAPVCGGPAVMHILTLGVDKQEQADAIRLVRVDFVNQNVSVLSIPRDLWVPIPGFADHGITDYRINAAYGYGEYFNGKGGGVVSFANMLYSNYAITFDHYLVVHFDGFEKLIDQIGGVDITLDKPLDGTIQGLNIFLNAGQHHLDGAKAMSFIRIRYPDNDAHRVDRQTMVMQSIITKLKDAATLTLIPGLVVTFLTDKSLITDLSMGDVSKLICLAGKLDADSVDFQSLPADMYKASEDASVFYYSIPSPSAAQFIQDFWNGMK